MNAPFQPETDAIDVRALLLRLWLRRWWFVGSVALFTALFVAAAFLMTPVYRATTVVIPAVNEQTGLGVLGSALGQLGGLASLAGINLTDSGSHTQEALAVLRSREFTEAFIRDQELMPLLFARRWDAHSRRWEGEPQDHPTLAQAFKVFDEGVREVTQDRRTGLITIAIEWKDPELAARWANDQVARLNAEMRARAIANVNASMGYLEKELEATSTVETREAISRLLEAQINQRMFANVTEEYALRVVDRALPPDRKDEVRPKKLLMLLLGFGLGVVIGVLGVLLRDALIPEDKVASRVP